MTAPKWNGAAIRKFQRDGTLPDDDPREKEISKAAEEFEGALSGALRKMRGLQEETDDNESENDSDQEE